MTLSEFATITTAISGIAVTISLIYLILQTRQGVRHTRALIQQGASARTVSIVLANQMKDASTVWCYGNGIEPTPEIIRKGQFHLMCQTSVTALEDIFHQHKDGLMQEEVFARNCYVHRNLLANPGYREYWNEQRGDIAIIAPKFCAFVDSLCTGEVTEFRFKV
jgi:hypothetical protein